MKYHLTEIFEIEELKRLCESFTNLNGTVTAVLDLEGNIHVATGWQPICTQFHRINNETRKLCTESDTILAGQLKLGLKYNVYKCKNGLVDIAMPIIVGDTHVGNFFTGQFFTEKPDIEFFRKQAQKYNFDEKEYLLAIEKAPVFSDNHIKATIEFLVLLTETIGNIGIKNLYSKEQTKQLEIEKNNLKKINKEHKELNEEYKIQNEDLQFTKEKAEESEQKFRLMVANSPDIIIIQDINGIVKFISPQIKELFGYEPDIFIGQSIPIQYIFQEDLEKVLNAFKSLQTNSQLVDLEYRFLRQNGDITWIQHIASPIIIKGKLAGIQNNIIDISKRKSDEEALSLSKLRYQTFFEQSHDGIIIIDPETASFLEFNEQTCRQLGYSHDEFAQLKIFDIEAIETISETKDRIKSVLETGKVEFETKQKTKQGEIIDVNVIAQIIEINNKKVYHCIWRDITEFKKNHLELIKAKERAEESDHLKTAFLLNMSHEIKTPMNSINGFSQMLNKPELSDEKRKSFTSIIINSSNQLQSIVENILTISALETKLEKTNIQAVNINSIILNLLAIFKNQASYQNISLYAKQQLTDKQSEILTDKTKVTQILTNLLSNALKYTHIGSIEFGYNLIDAVETKGFSSLLEFYVKDTGIGIEADLQEKIFERFVQVETGLTRKYGGNGLGLSISKGFVELLGGKIWLQSEFEKGSTFYFTIPYNPVHEIDKLNLPSEKNSDYTTILVAEDEEYNFLFIEELLINMNFKLIHAKDGKETFEICKTNQDIKLILMDIKMPIMDGHTAAKQIKEIRKDLSIIAQSAYTFDQYLEIYIENPFDDYISKPINEDELINKLMKFVKV